MSEITKIAIIGLDTSHSTELPKLMQDPKTPENLQVKELRTVSCLRFETPFQNKEGLDARQEYLESIGVTVTENFDEAVAECDAIIIAINDPSRHLEYFEKCAPLGKPIFLDKPFADTVKNMHKIIEIANKYKIRFFTSSSLRFDVDLTAVLESAPKVHRALIWGPIGKAAAGSDVIWYGCHGFEMLQTVMGNGAEEVSAYQDEAGYVFQIKYADERRGTVELTPKSSYGALLRDDANNSVPVKVTAKVSFYFMLLKAIVRFLNGEQVVELADAVEVMAMLEAADKSIVSGKAEKVYPC